MGRKCFDLTGKRFGRLVAIRLMDERFHGRHTVWECKCDCGKLTYVTTNHLRMGKIKSCGCLCLELSSARVKNFSTEDRILKFAINKNNTSGVKGVDFSNRDRLWRANITFNGHRYHLFQSKDKYECIAVRKEAEEAVARGNFEQWIKEYKGRK